MIVKEKPNKELLNNVKAYMDKLIFPLPEATWQALKSVIYLCSAPKGAIITDFDKIENHMRYTISGVFVIYYNSGADIFVESFHDTQFTLFNATSFNYRTPSTSRIKAITDVKWLQTSYNDYLEIIKNFADIEQMMFGWLKLYQKVLHDRENIKRLPSAIERYKIFCNQHPQAYKYAPQKDIASYIGVTQQTLSRLRREMLQSE